MLVYLCQIYFQYCKDCKVTMISIELKTYIKKVIDTRSFQKANYYLRCMKKAPHGGMFENNCPNLFLSHRPTNIFWLFSSHTTLPIPVQNASDEALNIFKESDCAIEDIMQFCFRITDPDAPDSSFKYFLALNGSIIKVKVTCSYELATAVSKSCDGYIPFCQNFDYDNNKLFSLFICFLIENRAYRITSLQEITKSEDLLDGSNDYGLYDITTAEFERQGFKLNDLYYLYNIFFDTSIGGPNSNMPKTISIVNTLTPPTKFYMRCDKELAVPYSQKVDTSTRDFVKWRGITIDFNNIEQQVLTESKPIIVHYDLETLHKIVIYLQKDHDGSGELFIHFNVEQLWNIENLPIRDDLILTNYLHGTYYPSTKLFSHIDYSVNQYERDKYISKYNDAVQETGIPINAHTQTRIEHYKIWCLKDGNLTPQIWADLVCATLDKPFRASFMEAIGGKYIDA